MNLKLLFPLVFVLSVHPVASQTVNVTVDAAAVRRTINPLLYGINTARWDESLFPGPDSTMLLTADRDAIAKIKASCVTLLKYPGGNDADSYIWNSPANNPAEMNTDEYIALCRATGAVPFITVNFNASSELAASWVRYCKQRGYGVIYWEIGDEQWGTWAKGHAAPEVYAEKYIAFVKAMRAVDPDIKVATNVPLGPHPEQWTTRVLRAAGEYVDMLTVTYFPQKWGKENDDSLLASTAQYRALFSDLKKEVASVLGTSRAESLLYVNVGYNSVNHSPGPQTIQTVNALWTADMLGTMAEAGTDIGCFWALHNSFPPRGGDYGYLSSEGLNAPHPSYYVFPLFARHFRGSLAGVTCADPALSIYAATRGKALTVITVNKDREQSRKLHLTMKGFIPRGAVRWWVLDEKRKAVEMTPLDLRSDRSALDVPPWSVCAFEFASRDSVDPPPNLARRAAATASSFSTIGPHFGPSSATDGDITTRWNSAAWTKTNGDETQWLQLRWAEDQKISRVRLQWGESPAVEFLLQTSADGARWDTVAHITDGRGGDEDITLPESTHGRYLRMTGLRGSKGISAYSLREIEVFGKP